MIIIKIVIIICLILHQFKDHAVCVVDPKVRMLLKCNGVREKRDMLSASKI